MFEIFFDSELIHPTVFYLTTIPALGDCFLERHMLSTFFARQTTVAMEPVINLSTYHYYIICKLYNGLDSLVKDQ